MTCIYILHQLTTIVSNNPTNKNCLFLIQFSNAAKPNFKYLKL